MKVFVFAFAVLFASVSAGPQLQQDGNQARFIDGIIIGVIEDAAQTIRDRGLDPFVKESWSFHWSLPVTDLIDVEAVLENLYVEGISNIVINDISFSLFSSRLDFDIELPRITARLGHAAAGVRLFDRQTGAYLSGSLEIVGLRVRGRVVVGISVISGVTIRDLNINLSLKDIKSNLNVVIHQRDISNTVNWILGEYIPYVFNSFIDDLNKLLEHIIREIIERIL